MDYRIDDKGKFYTSHVSKHPVAVLAHTPGAVIHGTMHLLPDHRALDELNLAPHFVAITDARVCDAQTGSVLYSSNTILLNKDHVIWLIPCDDQNEFNHPGSANSD